MAFIRILLACLFFVSCTTTSSYRPERDYNNPLVKMWMPFAPERLRTAYDHTLYKFYRTRSDCQPNCPKIDIWQYQYKDRNGAILTDTIPISSRKEHWKAHDEARIMAITLYGDNPIYYLGLLDYLSSFRVVKEMNKINDPIWGYETFTVRVYVAKRNPKNASMGPLKNETPDDFIKLLLDAGCEIVYVDNWLPKVGKDATFWRFMVMDEKMPEGSRIRYILRDADWRLTAGEAYAVGEWIASKLRFHRMNITSMCMGPLVASFYGGSHTGDNGFNDIHARMENFPYRYEYGDDELFSRDMIWPYIKYSGSVMTHIYSRDWKSVLAMPYAGACEEPTQLYCDAMRSGGNCPDILMPDNIIFPQIELGMRKTLKELMEMPGVFDMHLDNERGERVRKALSVD